VDQVGEQCHGAGEREDGSLGEGGQRKHAEAQRDRLDPLARAKDGAIDEAMRVTVLTLAALVVIVAVPVVTRLAVVIMLIPLPFEFLCAPVAHEACVIGSG
jgi:hypothetical protein